MQIQISKTFLKWKNDNKGNVILTNVIDKFLLQVFMASDMSKITPQPKAAGNNLRKSVGTVDEFTLNKKYRLYSKYGEFVRGVPVFRLASGGIKGNTNQNDDVLSALSMFDKGTTEEWITWEPENLPAPVQTPVQNVVPTDNSANAPIVSKKKKSKGKPLDENGLTVAERKALHKRKQEEELRLAKQKKDAKNAERRAALAAAAKTDDAVPNTSNVPVSITTNRAKVEQLKQNLIQIQTALINEDEPAYDVTPPADVATPVCDAHDAPLSPDNTPDNTPDNVKDSGDTDNAPIVTVNDTPVNNPVSLTGNETFKPELDVQYELEIIECKMQIEASKIAIAQQRIEIENAKIAKELLAIKKLQLLQAQKQSIK